MKRILRALTVAVIVAGLVWAAICIVEDAKAGKGAFMSTETYRGIIAEGKR